MIGFFRHYKKKSQNIIVVREITFAQSLKIIFSDDLSNNLLFRNSAAISEFGNHFGIRQPFRNSATISEFGNNFGIRQQFRISVSAIRISENLKTISATILNYDL